MNNTIIDTMYSDFLNIIQYLDEAGEVSFSNIVDSTFKKTLAVSIGSYFEDLVRQILEIAIQQKSNGDEIVCSFVKNKALARQYHTYFKWDANNANSFFGLFGERFKEDAVKEVGSSAESVGALWFREISKCVV